VFDAGDAADGEYCPPHQHGAALPIRAGSNPAGDTNLRIRRSGLTLVGANALWAEALHRELPATAAYLGIDITVGVGLTNLTAVAITQLAWRNGPVEL
jgi:hypothetical protein